MRLSVTVLGCFPRFWVDSDAFWTSVSRERWGCPGLRPPPCLRRRHLQERRRGLSGGWASPMPASGPTAPLCAVVVVAGDAVDGLRVTGGPVDEAVAAVDASGPESSEPVVRGTRAS